MAGDIHRRGGDVQCVPAIDASAKDDALPAHCHVTGKQHRAAELRRIRDGDIPRQRGGAVAFHGEHVGLDIIVEARSGRPADAQVPAATGDHVAKPDAAGGAGHHRTRTQLQHIVEHDATHAAELGADPRAAWQITAEGQQWRIEADSAIENALPGRVHRQVEVAVESLAELNRAGAGTGQRTVADQNRCIEVVLIARGGHIAAQQRHATTTGGQRRQCVQPANGTREIRLTGGGGRQCMPSIDRPIKADVATAQAGRVDIADKLDLLIGLQADGIDIRAKLEGSPVLPQGGQRRAAADRASEPGRAIGLYQQVVSTIDGAAEHDVAAQAAAQRHAATEPHGIGVALHAPRIHTPVQDGITAHHLHAPQPGSPSDDPAEAHFILRIDPQVATAVDGTVERDVPGTR